MKEVDWSQLGIQLNVPGHILKHIDRENPGNESRKLSEVLQYWIDNAEPEASWEKILEALQRIGSHFNIVSEIQSKYVTNLPSHLTHNQSTSCTIVKSSLVAKEDVCCVIDEVLRLVHNLSRLPTKFHELPCTDAHLMELSESVVECGVWENLSYFLHLSARDAYRGAKVMLREWRRKFGQKANYR